MKNYSINKITNDVCQFIVTFHRDTFASFFEMFDYNFSNKETISFKEILKDAELAKIITVIVLMQMQTLHKYETASFIDPKLKIVEETNEDITLVINQIIFDDENVKLIYPKVSDINFEEISEFSDAEKTKIIDDILLANGFFENVSVEQGNLFMNDIYIKILGKENNLKDLLTEEQYNSLTFDTFQLIEYKVKDQIKVKNNLLKNGNIIYTISKIVERKPLMLNDEIVQKLNYKNCKNCEEFKRKVFSNVKEVRNFDKFIYVVKNRMQEINKSNVSKEFFEMYKNSIACDDSDEKIYKDICYIKICHFIVKEMKKIDYYNTMLLENIIKLDYDLKRLYGYKKDVSYEEYLEHNIYNLKLCMHIKKQ